jgi:hypothetical protein
LSARCLLPGPLITHIANTEPAAAGLVTWCRIDGRR